MPLMDCRCPLPEDSRNLDDDDYGDDGGNDGNVGDDHDGNCTDCH